MDILLKFFSEITFKDIKETFSLLGGSLGFFSFYYQFLRRFNPVFSISNKISFHLEKETGFNRLASDYRLKSIYLKINISNSRAVVGNIEDVILRLYDTSSTRPEVKTLYLNGVGTSPSDIDDSVGLTIYPKSSSSLGLLFKPGRLVSMILNISESKYMNADLYFKTKNGKKWKKIETLHLCSTEFDSSADLDSDQTIVYSTFNRDQLRRDALKFIDNPVSNIYHGWWDRWFEAFKARVKFKSLWPFKSVKNLFFIFRIFIIRVCNLLFTLGVKRTVVFNKSSESLEVKFGSVKNHKSVQEVFDSIFRELVYYTEKIDEKFPDAKNKISIKKVDNERFSVSGKRGVVDAYITGADTIYIASKGRGTKVINYCLKREKFMWGGYYFTLNDKPVFIKSAAFLIYDSLSLHLK